MEMRIKKCTPKIDVRNKQIYIVKKDKKAIACQFFLLTLRE
jgi:hypothetical protein